MRIFSLTLICQCFHRWPGAGFDMQGYPQSGYDYNGYNQNSVKEERITTVLQKGLRGFGFTIVGGDHPEEMLQVKSIVPGGPASVDGKIRIGDALTKVNGMIILVQSISAKTHMMSYFMKSI